MNAASIKERLTTKTLGREVIYYNTTDSTNTQAKKYCENTPCTEGTIFVAGKQSKGKGTDGNDWESGQNNLSLSIVFDSDAKINTLFPLYPAVALAKTLKTNYQIDAHVKWPNDVLIGKKKISGILCEGVAGQFMIVGIGVNVNDHTFPEALKNIATSIKLETSRDVEIETLLQQFLQEYEALLYGNADIRCEWLKHTKMIGKTILALQDGKTIESTIVDMSPEGFLLVRNTDGTTETWMARRGLDISTNY